MLLVHYFLESNYKNNILKKIKTITIERKIICNKTCFIIHQNLRFLHIYEKSMSLEFSFLNKTKILLL